MRLLAVFAIVFWMVSCRASFDSVGEASGINGATGEQIQSGDVVIEEENVNSQNPSQDLPVDAGEDPNQKPPGDDDGNDADPIKDVRLIIETSFGPGENGACADGGKKIVEGIDRNQDGALSGDEIEKITFVCDDGSTPKCCCCCCVKDDAGQNGKKSVDSTVDYGGNKGDADCCKVCDYVDYGSKGDANCCECCDVDNGCGNKAAGGKDDSGQNSGDCCCVAK